MKRIVHFLMMLCVVVLLSGCQGNYAPVDFKDSIVLSESGIVEEEVLTQLKNENAIANFVGEYEQYPYEWIIFGSDISETQDINLSLSIAEVRESEVEISFANKNSFAFPMLLSIELDEKWDAQNASLYQDEQLVASVSITGSQRSILNVSVQGLEGTYVIRADKLVEVEEVVSESSTEDSGEDSMKLPEREEPKVYVRESVPSEKDNYLAEVNQASDKVYLSDVSSSAGVTFAPSKQEQTLEDRKDVAMPQQDTYLTDAKSNSSRVYSSGKSSMKDKYETDPIPEGKPMPVEPENQEIKKEITHTCTFSIECSTILNNLGDLDPDKRELVPTDGVILPPTKVTFYEGESVYDVLMRLCKEKGIHMEASWTPIYNSAYVEGIHNLYEFDCGELSGWMYRVNGWYPNYGSSRYQLIDGEVVEWRFTCDLGRDVGCDWMG